MFPKKAKTKGKGKLRSPTGGSPTSQEHTNEQTRGTINSSKASISKIEKLLLDANVYPRSITRIIREYSEDRILRKAAHWKGGELVRAIEEDWQPKARGSAAPDYAQGQFADFWDA